jgi:Na+-translocating ferredoxin:NAD+ oxidoreductase RnfD subunit/ferredoxin
MPKYFPLVRSSWSNEKIQAALFGVCLLYLLPRWIHAPVEMLTFGAVTALALLLDAILGGIRHKQPVCAVSGGVTAAIFQILTPGIPLWAAGVGIVAALVFGKHLQGGSGKNITNPAVLGALIVGLIVNIPAAPIPGASLMLPAALLSLPFLLFRPLAGMGFIAGTLLTVAVLPGHDIRADFLINALFWASLIITDPVTSTPRPIVGLVGGFCVGFLPAFSPDPGLMRAVLLLAYNLLSRALENAVVPKRLWLPVIGRVRKIFSLTDATIVHDRVRRCGTQPVQEESLSVEAVLERIRDAGVFGMGGAAFSTYRKLDAVRESSAAAKYLLINAVECDPGLIHDQWLMRTFPQEINRGVAIVNRCASFNQAILVTKNDLPAAFTPSCEVRKIPSVYPAGAERLLIKAVLGVDLPAGARPAEKGILVINLQTVFAIYEAVCFGQKADSRYLTIADFRTKAAAVARVRLGSPIDAVVADVAGASGPIFTGGGVMNAAKVDEAEEVSPRTNFIATAEFPRYKESPHCFRCGWCWSVCPAGLHPGKIAEAWDTGRHQQLAKYPIDECLECGSCSYVCLAGKDLTSRMREAKKDRGR